MKKGTLPSMPINMHRVARVKSKYLDKKASIATVNSLGMSYEMKNAGVKDIRKNPWILTKAPFTGAAVLMLCNLH